MRMDPVASFAPTSSLLHAARLLPLAILALLLPKNTRSPLARSVILDTFIPFNSDIPRELCGRDM